MQGDTYAITTITTQLNQSIHHNHLIVYLLFIRDGQKDAAAALVISFLSQDGVIYFNAIQPA